MQKIIAIFRVVRFMFAPFCCWKNKNEWIGTCANWIFQPSKYQRDIMQLDFGPITKKLNMKVEKWGGQKTDKVAVPYDIFMSLNLHELEYTEKFQKKSGPSNLCDAQPASVSASGYR